MATKSPTTSVKSREVIGVDMFSQRREVFDKHDTVFLPLPSPTTLTPGYKEVDPIVTSNHGKTTSNFKRNTPGSSSMRENRTEERNYEFRARKYSDNFTSESNQSDNVDYRRTMTERTRRLSQMRREFLNSNLHEPGESPFSRTGGRASLPAASILTYKIESPKIYKFPFAEPYATPPPVRRVVVDLGPSEVDSGKENKDPEVKTRHHSLSPEPNNIDHQKLFEQLVKRYSPQRKPIDWKLPPTKPRVVGSVPKSTSSVSDTSGSVSKIKLDTLSKTEITKSNDDVFEKEKDGKPKEIVPSEASEEVPIKPIEVLANHNDLSNNKRDTNGVEDALEDKNISLSEIDEKNDRVPELSTIHRQLSKEGKKVPPVVVTDLTIPALIKKMTEEGDDLENHKNAPKKVKRKRSFIDKLLGRNKNK